MNSCFAASRYPNMVMRRWHRTLHNKLVSSSATCGDCWLQCCCHSVRTHSPAQGRTDRCCCCLLQASARWSGQYRLGAPAIAAACLPRACSLTYILTHPLAFHCLIDSHSLASHSLTFLLTHTHFYSITCLHSTHSLTHTLTHLQTYSLAL